MMVNGRREESLYNQENIPRTKSNLLSPGEAAKLQGKKGNYANCDVHPPPKQKCSNGPNNTGQGALNNNSGLSSNTEIF
eukprot:670554-Ditylum_brightwellii.AAC.1